MIFKTELKRAVLNKKMLLAILLGIACQCFSTFSKIRNDLFASSSVYTDPAELMALIENATNRYQLWYFSTDLYSIVIPLICCIPFVTSYIEDNKNGFINFLSIRVSYKKYVLSKIVSVFLSGFISVCISSSIFYAFISYIKSNSLEYCSLSVYGAFSDIFAGSPDLYVMIYILVCSIMGGVFAVMGLAVSSKFDNLVVATISPMIFWYVGTFILDIFQVTGLQPAAIDAYFVRPNTTVFHIGFQLIFYLGISVFIFISESKKVRI